MKQVSTFLFACTGLPHTQGTSGIFKLKKISGKLRETQGILIYYLNSGKFWFFLISSRKF